MKNIEIRKRLKMGSEYSIYDKDKSFNHQSFVLNNELFQKIINKKNKQSVTLLEAFNTYKNSKKTLSYDQNQKNKLSFINKPNDSNLLNFNSTGQYFVRQQKTAKQQLMPKKIPSEIKQIQMKINQFSEKNGFYKERINSMRTSKAKPKESSNLLRFYKNSQIDRKLLSNSYNQRSQLSLSLDNKGQWYVKAIEAHINNNSSKNNLDSNQQSKFNTKVIINQKKQSNHLYPKLQTGFKKRAVSYQVKYI